MGAYICVNPQRGSHGGGEETRGWTFPYVWAKVQGRKYAILTYIHLHMHVLIDLMDTTILSQLHNYSMQWETDKIVSS